jgi:hypothetical protein
MTAYSRPGVDSRTGTEHIIVGPNPNHRCLLTELGCMSEARGSGHNNNTLQACPRADNSLAMIAKNALQPIEL